MVIAASVIELDPFPGPRHHCSCSHTRARHVSCDSNLPKRLSEQSMIALRSTCFLFVRVYRPREKRSIWAAVTCDGPALSVVHLHTERHVLLEVSTGPEYSAYAIVLGQAWAMKLFQLLKRRHLQVLATGSRGSTSTLTPRPAPAYYSTVST